jgi:hypothetical protein
MTDLAGRGLSAVRLLQASGCSGGGGGGGGGRWPGPRPGCTAWDAPAASGGTMNCLVRLGVRFRRT